jgi:predicted XRE-type DNA-binding protein
MVWQEKHGFGIFSEEWSYGSQPSEIYRESLLAVARVVQIIGNWKRQQAYQPLDLAELRTLLEISQEHLAGLMHVQQTAVSKLERRKDIKLSSLANYINALGGRIEMRVHFDGMDAFIPLTKKIDE